MNIERLEQLAATIEVQPHRPEAEYKVEPLSGYVREEAPAGFSMAVWHCGTVCCIGGWAEALWAGLGLKVEKTCEALGITEEQGDELFFKNTDPYVTPKQAAWVIRNLIATGEVNWRASYDHS